MSDELQERIDATYPKGVRVFYSVDTNANNFPRVTSNLHWMWVFTEEWFDIQRGVIE